MASGYGLMIVDCHCMIVAMNVVSNIVLIGFGAGITLVCLQYKKEIRKSVKEWISK